MKRLIIYFLIILASVWLGLKIYQNPGYILIYYQHWAIETTVWMLILFLLVVFFLLHLLLKLFGHTISLPKQLSVWWQARAERKSIKWLNKGYGELLLGNFKKAEKSLLKSASNRRLSFVSYMIAAQVADRAQVAEKRDQYLLQAKQVNQKNPALVDMAHIQFLLKNNQPEQALTILVSLQTEKPKGPMYYNLLAETYVQLQDWYHLQIILKDLKKNKVFSNEKFSSIEKQTYLNLLQEPYFSDFSEVQILWNKLPRYLRHDPALLMAYASHLNRWHRGYEAEELIRKELKKNFNSQLMEYYVTTRSEQPSKQVALGEKYLKENTEDASSLRAMGILCLRNRLWGQARDYFESSLRMQTSAETYSALGYIYEKLGESEKALNYYRKGLTYLTPFVKMKGESPWAKS